MKKTDLLPVTLNGAMLAQWLKENAIETFIDEQKVFFTPEQIAEFEHESSINGRELNRLNDLLSKVGEYVKKGNHTEMPITIEIPVTAGTKKLDQFRRQNDDAIDKGYEVIETEIFGIVDRDNETLEFFTTEGVHIPERTRGLSPKEIKTHVGIFARENRVEKTA